MRMIGRFQECHGVEYVPFVSSKLLKEEKERVLWYLRNGRICAAVPGIMRDVFTGEAISCEMYVYTDGQFMWETETIYYVDQYDMALPEEILKCAMNAKMADVIRSRALKEKLTKESSPKC